MNAKELKLEDVMCGDLVDVRNDASPDTPHIEKITPSHLLRDEHWYGIELTPEILEKNGFVLKEDEKGAYGVNIAPYYTRDDVPFEVFCDGEPFAIWFKDPINIKYVHQLQHALHLCGIEKEIVL